MMLLGSPEALAESLKAAAERIRNATHAGQPLDRAFFLLEHAAVHIRQTAEERRRDAERIRELEARVVRLGGGFDRRGLDGDPRDKPVPQEFKRGSWVDRGTDA